MRSRREGEAAELATPIIETRNLGVDYLLESGTVNAVRDVSFQINPGEIVGLVGESGCGKSTLAMTFLKIVTPPGKITKGKIFYYSGADGQNGPVSVLEMTSGKLRRYRWKEVSMIFQASMNSLNPVIRVEEQLIDTMLDHGYDEKEADRRVNVYLNMAGLDPKVRRSFPHELSGGMKQRVVIAMALCCEPKFLIADEPTTALDVVVQRQILDQLKELSRKLGLSVLFITHDISVIAGLADRLAVMYAGKIVEVGTVTEVFKTPLHPYTAALMSSFPSLTGEKKKLRGIPGAPPDLRKSVTECPFAPRCPRVFDKCHTGEPPLIKSADGHMAACYLIDMEK